MTSSSKLKKRLIISSLLVVTAFPVFYWVNSYEDNRREAAAYSCTSNEKQIGLGLLEYIQDYDNCFPCGVDWNGKTGFAKDAADKFPQVHGWVGQIYPYVRIPRAFLCPKDRSASFERHYAISYGMNWHLGVVGYGADRLRGTHIARYSDLVDPTKTVMLAEEQGDYTDLSNPRETGSNYVTCYNPPYGGNGGVMATGNTPFSSYPTIPAGERHGGVSNFLAADGHVQPLKPSQVSGGYYQKRSGWEQNSADTPSTTDVMRNIRGDKYEMTFSVN